MHHTPKVSIVIVNYNGAQFIENLFKSLYQQTYRDFEVIFVDNNSQDNSLQLLQKLINEYKPDFPIKIIKNKENLGYCKGNNIGVKHAKGEYIILLNNDVILDKNAVKELVKTLDQNPDITASQSRLLDYEAKRLVSDGYQLDYYGYVQRLILLNKAKKLSPFFVSYASGIVRKKDYIKVGGFDEKLTYGDYDFCWRLRLIGKDFTSTPTSICRHYGSFTWKKMLKLPQRLHRIHKEIIRVLLKNYSLKNIIKRLPIALTIMAIESIRLSQKHRNPAYIVSFIKAITWNLTVLKDTIQKRQYIQKIRTVDDNEIENKMVKKPIYLTRNWVKVIK